MKRMSRFRGSAQDRRRRRMRRRTCGAHAGQEGVGTAPAYEPADKVHLHHGVRAREGGVLSHLLYCWTHGVAVREVPAGRPWAVVAGFSWAAVGFADGRVAAGSRKAGRQQVLVGACKGAEVCVQVPTTTPHSVLHRPAITWA